MARRRQKARHAGSSAAMASGGGISSPVQGAGYDAPDTSAWFAPFVSADGAALIGRETASARTRDLDRNNRYVRAIVSRLVDMMVGSGLRLSSKPDARALRIERQAATDLGRLIESEWRLFAEDPLYRADARRKVTLNGQFRVAARTFVSMNEAAAVLKWKPEGEHFGTCLQVVDPDRISNPAGRPDSNVLRGGIEFDLDGAVIAAHVRNAHPSDYWLGASMDAMTWTRVPMRDERGRPVFIHAFEPEREDQTRAISAFAAALPALKQLGRFSDAELGSALLNAFMAMFIKTSRTPQEVAESMSTSEGTDAENLRLKFYTDNPIRVNGTRIPVLPFGDELTLNTTAREASSFVEFEQAFLQQIAASSGVSYEQASSNWSRTNYSSARASLVEIWRTVTRLSAQFVEQFVWPVYLAFLDEAIETGRIPVPPGAPDLFEAPAAWLRARWLGPPRGYIDPVKEAQAAQIRIDTMVSTLERECAEQGLDVEDVLDQLAREQEELASRGLTRASTATLMTVRAPTDEPAAAPAKD
jgi:lambda family phage portal protein